MDTRVTPQIRFRCYAEGRKGRWMAVCLDLDIAVEGRSLKEVVGSLEQAIAEYLDYVTTLPVAEQRALLARRAPLSLRLKFLWHALGEVFGGHNGDGGPSKDRAEFTLHASCPA